ncbi:MAG: DUF3604 domain-containing protein [Candidatus Pelagadaptatus aseana]|uniref:DUF3604 domain-containing protein n=1 Tax=Candidatus Pelagadaptatus aseana TaxID=3120508 RepID=UPI0039B3335B
MNPIIRNTLAAAMGTVVVSSSLTVTAAVSGENFSPYVGDYPDQVLWGDTHLHTNLSLDARAFGVTLSPEMAYRFARGETVTSSNGKQVKLLRPLDWLVISDHSDALGAMNELIKGNPELMVDPTVKDWNKRINQGGETGLMAVMDVISAFTKGKTPDVLTAKPFVKSVWEDYTATADHFNEPGRFTAMIGYEWTSTTAGNNLHRNVLYRDGADKANQVMPFTVLDSDNPQDLWQWLDNYEKHTGGNVLAIAHNGNLSNGTMFPMEKTFFGATLDKNYAETRARWEPLYEVTQIKGDGEAHPYLSPNDEFADYETWDKSNLGPNLKKPGMLQYEYAREALKNGLKLEQQLGVNPYKFGLIGSTDSHTGLPTTDEANFFGKHSAVEPNAKRWKKKVGEFGEISHLSWTMASSGYAAVWAKDNTRASIFDALKRRETYATTGSRMKLRFFGGWDYRDTDAGARPLAAVGYAKGVPMGGDLTAAPKDQSPTFLIEASRDPEGGNLDRIQVIKGWLDAKGKTHEKIYNVAWSGERQLQANGKLPGVGNTVDVKSATWTNTIGASELRTVWSDPEFDPQQRAFYYVRVIEIPTPRWTSYDAKRFDVRMDRNVPMITQERGYTSPIWYTP